MAAICSPQLGLSPESNSGGEVYDREVLTRLADKHHVFTFLPKGRPHPVRRNLNITFAPWKIFTPPHTYSLVVLPYLLKTFATHPSAILRIHNVYFLAPALLAFKKVHPQVPVIGSLLHLEDGLNHALLARSIHLYDHIITISDSTKKEIISRLKYPAAKVSVAYPGIPEHFKPKPRAKSQSKNILFLGGLKARKNLPFLLTVFSRLQHRNATLTLAGTGPDLPRLKQLVKQLDLSHKVIFAGYIPEKEKINYYHQADVLVLPSLKEGFGMTITEAAACGIPSVGADHYSIKEIIKDGQTGYLAKPNDAADWSNKLDQLLSQDQLRLTMGKNAEKFARGKFSWSKNISIHQKVIAKLSR